MEKVESFRILIVDDSPEDRVLYRRLLGQDEGHDYRILETDSGEEGLALCQNEQPDRTGPSPSA